MDFSSFEAVMLIFGVFLLLLGILGKIEAHQVKLGTNSKIARSALIILGLFFILIANGKQSFKEFREMQHQHWQNMNSPGFYQP